jgi:serine phosphatase RsbU (regulator of sigma subunit)
MLQLEIFDSNGRRTVAVDSVPFSIGRSSDNQLQLPDVQVSRRHAEVVAAESGWLIRDCGSRFGTYVNDRQVSEAPFGPGDRVRVGQTEFRILEAQSTMSGSGAIDFRHMNALLAGMRALGSSGVLDEVLAIVLDSALDVAGAERGFILLPDSDGQLRLTVARGRGQITLTNAQTSRRIPEEVFATGTDRIVTDLQDDAHAPFHSGTVALGIRHVMCTPLNVIAYGGKGPARRIGVLYLDSRERGYLRHVGLLHALAAEAAVVIENARLYREVVEKERADQELRIAAEIQQSLLPPPEHSAAIADLAAVTVPCRAVGGDLFDYVSQDDGTFGFVVGDVAGKGTSAALLTAVVQGLFAAEAGLTGSASAVLERVNRALCRRAVAARFVTAFFGQLCKDGQLSYCNAGHNPPFLLKGKRLVRLEKGGPVLGLFEHAVYDTGEETMSSGDLLVMYSDGVTEAENVDGEEFGDERLAETILSSRAGSAGDVRDAVQLAVRQFSGAAPVRDDVTVMVIKAR